MDELETVLILTTVALGLWNGLFDGVVVAWLSGRQSVKKITAWMQSKESTPYMDMIADRAMLRMNPVVSELKTSMKADLEIMAKDFQKRTAEIQTSITNTVIDQVKSLPNTNDALLPFQESLKDTIEDLQNQTLQALNTQLNAAVDTIKTEIVASIDGKLKSFEAVKAKQLKKALNQFGVQVNDMGEAVQNELLAESEEGMTPYHVAALNILSQSPSEEFSANNPTAAMLWKTAQVQGIKALQDGIKQSKGATLNNKAAIIPVNNSGIFR